MRCHKTGETARHEFSWLAQLPTGFRPPGLTWVEELEEMRYDFVEGVHPDDWRVVHKAAEVALWQTSRAVPRLPMNPLTYVSYVEDVVTKVRTEITLPDLRRTLEVIAVADDLTQVCTCHGDLTMANVVVDRDGAVVFIDPGHHRGLPCREIDEAKILQSLDGFDVVYRGWPQPRTYPKMFTRRVHWALLVTHYVRLMRHVRHQPALEFARQRVWELAEVLS